MTDSKPCDDSPTLVAVDIIETCPNCGFETVVDLDDSAECEDSGQSLAEAAIHVWRQQHAGTHEQDRYDAREWLRRYNGKPCQCNLCLQLGKRTDLAGVELPRIVRR